MLLCTRFQVQSTTANATTAMQHIATATTTPHFASPVTIEAHAFLLWAASLRCRPLSGAWRVSDSPRPGLPRQDHLTLTICCYTHGLWSLAAVFRRSGRRLCSQPVSCRVCDLTTSELKASLVGHSRAVLSVAMNNKLLVSGSGDNTIRWVEPLSCTLAIYLQLDLTWITMRKHCSRRC